MIEAALQPQNTVLRDGFSLGARPLRRFSVEEYHALATAGVLTAQDRVELLDGLIVTMSPIGPMHACCVDHVVWDLLAPLLTGWHARIQHPITLSTSEPQPDVAIVRGKSTDYATSHPAPSDIGLVIEVADTTLTSDRQKASIFAADRVPQYWIIDLNDRRLEVYTAPRASRSTGAVTYRTRRILDESSPVTFTLAGKQIARIAVADLFAVAADNE